MKQDKDTKIKLLASARQEFIEKGYMNASLRNICKNAGVTTGALYFFFKDKADLFEQLVKGTVETIYSVMSVHFSNENEQAEKGALNHLDDIDSSNDYEDTKKIVHLMYQHRDDVLMLLTKSQGSPYEGIVDRFIDTVELHYRNMADHMEKVNLDKHIDDRVIHWLSHQQIDMFVYMITHIDNEQQALLFMQQSIAYMTAGWIGLFSN